MRQNAKRRQRNSVFRRRLHDIQKEFYSLIGSGKDSEAAQMLPKVYKTIDTCAKRHIIPKNRAARMKSKAQKYLNEIVAKK